MQNAETSHRVCDKFCPMVVIPRSMSLNVSVMMPVSSGVLMMLQRV